ncbi:hypothetical protein GCM10027188_23370 [Lysobacter humi (ex Lee et al. 2017)]
MRDRIEDAQAGVRGIARDQDDLDARRFRRRTVVELEQLAHQREGDAGREDVALATALVVGIGLEPLQLEQVVAFLEVEERPRGDGDDQGIGIAIGHGVYSACGRVARMFAALRGFAGSGRSCPIGRISRS